MMVPPAKKLEDLIHLAELCVDLLQQNEEHYAEVSYKKIIFHQNFHRCSKKDTKKYKKKILCFLPLTFFLPSFLSFFFVYIDIKTKTFKKIYIFRASTKKKLSTKNFSHSFFITEVSFRDWLHISSLTMCMFLRVNV